MADDFAGASKRLVAAAESAARHADPAEARRALAAVARELAACIEALPVAHTARPEETKQTRIDKPPVEPPKPPPVEVRPPAPAGGSPEDALFAELAEVAKEFAASPAPVDPADYEWMAQAAQVFQSQPEERLVKFFASIVLKLDALIAYARWTKGAPVDVAKSARTKAIAILAKRGVPEPPGEPVKIRSKSPAGTSLGFGTRRLESSGDGTDGSDAIEAAARALGTDPAGDEREFRAAVLRQLEKYLIELPGKNEDFENTLLRYSVNELDKIGDPARPRPLLAILKARGINEIIVQIGAIFDESYSPSKFDRRKQKGAGARNSIIKVLQRGFIDRKGNCIQKCVVAIVSDE